MCFPDALERITAALCKSYQVQQLDCDESTHLMPLALFKGLCQALGENSNPFGHFSGWYMTEEHLKLWNATFKDRHLQSLKITLINDVQPQTLKDFIAILLTLDPACSVEVDRVGSGLTHLSFPYEKETQKLFVGYKNMLANKNPQWIWE